jgi:hypothetical protein
LFNAQIRQGERWPSHVFSLSIALNVFTYRSLMPISHLACNRQKGTCIHIFNI